VRLEWESTQLGEVCNFVRGPFGGSLKKSCFQSEGYAVYEQQHAINNQFSDFRYYVDNEKFTEMLRFEVFPGDLIMSCSGTMGKIAIVPEKSPKGIINQALLKLTVKKGLNVQFLKYWMTSPNFQMQLGKHSKGVAIKNVASVKVLKEISLGLPPLPEQKRIVAILDEAFAGISLAVANAEKNLANARELFDSYLNNIFIQKGDGWEEKALIEITSILGDGLHGTPKYSVKGEYYFINGNNLNDGTIEFKEKTKRVSFDEYQKYKKELTDRTVLVSINGTLGNVAFYNGEKITLGKSACYFNLLEGINKNYIKHVISSSYFLNYAHMEATGATIKNVSLKSMRAFKVPLPALEIQNNIVRRLDALSVETKKLETIYQQKLTALNELKQSILQKAFTGELTQKRETA